MVRGNDEGPPLEQPKSSLSGGDYVVIWKKSSLLYKLGRLGFIY